MTTANTNVPTATLIDGLEVGRGVRRCPRCPARHEVVVWAHQGGRKAPRSQPSDRAGHDAAFWVQDVRPNHPAWSSTQFCPRCRWALIGGFRSFPWTRHASVPELPTPPLFSLGSFTMSYRVNGLASHDEVTALIDRHTRGDHGVYGIAATAKLTPAQRWCPPLAGQLAVNIVAVETGLGLVRSRYPARDARPTNRPEESFDILTMMPGPGQEEHNQTIMLSTVDNVSIDV